MDLSIHPSINTFSLPLSVIYAKVKVTYLRINGIRKEKPGKLESTEMQRVGHD